MPSPTIFSYSIEDESGNSAVSDLFMAYDAATATVGSLLGAAAAYGGLIDAVTGGRIREFNVKINGLPDPAWKAAALVDSDIQKTLLENFNVADTKYPQEFIVPAVRGTLIDAADHPILTAGGAIALLNAAIVGGSGAFFPNNKFLLDIISLRDAALAFRQRKGALAKSRVKA